MEEIKEKEEEEENNFEVVVRCQPLIQRTSYQSRGIKQEQALFIDQQQSTLTVQLINEQQEKQEKLFSFKKIISPNESQMEVYQSVAYPLVESTFQGFTSTIFAYGQTGSGKTYTIEGETDNKQLKNQGFILRAVDQIFEHIENNPQFQYIVRISILNIYNESIEDMLQRSKDKLSLRENAKKGIHIEDLTELVVVNKEQMLRVIEESEQIKQIKITYTGTLSSRCYKVVQFKVQSFNQINQQLKTGKLSFVTMAGSERIAKKEMTQNLLQESINIHQGVRAFGNIIVSLTSQERQNVPYRDSKITRLFQQSLGGNAKTVLLATVASDQLNSEETVYTLRLAFRATQMKNKATANIIVDPLKIQTFKKEYQNIYSNKQVCFKTL